MTSKLLKFYKEVHSLQHPYCILCLRTQDERRLVNAKGVKMFLETLSTEHCFKTLQVCYMCEAKAMSAMKFISHVKFGLTVDKVFRSIEDVKSYSKLSNDMDKRINGSSSPVYQTLDNLYKCELILSQVRTNTEFNITEMLIVGSEDVFSQTHVPEKETTVPEFETIVLDDDDDDVKFSVDTKKSRTEPQNKQTVVNNINVWSTSKQITYRDDSIQSIAKKRPFSKKRQRSNTSFEDKRTSNGEKSPTCLPVITNDNQVNPALRIRGDTDAPNLMPVSLSTPDGLVAIGDCDLDAEDKLTPRIMTTADNSQFLLHPVVGGVDGKFYCPTLENGDVPIAYLQQSEITKINLSPHLPISALNSMETPNSRASQVPKSSFNLMNKPNPSLSSSRNKSKLANETTNENNLSKHNLGELIDNLFKEKIDELKKTALKVAKGKSNETIAPESNAMTTVTVDNTYLEKIIKNNEKKSASPPKPIAKTAVMNMGRIDWEDKIPMDVISFMDTTSSKNIGKSCAPGDANMMGFITDVRSEVNTENKRYQ